MTAQAMLTLFRCLTGESYNGIMHDLMPTPTVLARCDAAPDDRANCGTWASIPFFISFYVLGAMVALNLVVAVVLDAFADDAAAEPAKYGEIGSNERPSDRNLVGVRLGPCAEA